MIVLGISMGKISSAFLIKMRDFWMPFSPVILKGYEKNIVN